MWDRTGMSKLDPDSCWEYAAKGDWATAYKAVTAGIKEDGDNSIDYFNRGLFQLGNRNLKGALNDFQKARQLSSDNDEYPIAIGVVLWWLGRAVEAVATWGEALDAAYTDAAGGVEVPAFLLFAAVKLGDPK